MPRKKTTKPADEFESWATTKAERQPTPIEREFPQVVERLDQLVELRRANKTERTLTDFWRYAQERFGFNKSLESLQQLIQRRHGTTWKQL